jgi:ABC-type transport system substrate-binding protein
MDDRPARGFAPACLAAVLLALSLGGCTRAAAPPPARALWVFAAAPPPFDPGGPPDPRRWAVERMLSFGLLEADSNGVPVPAAAASVEVSDDSLSYTFRLRDRLAFVDGTPCASSDFAAAVTAPLARTDHGTRAWQLAAVRGVDRVRAGRPLPELGIETPDERTLVFRLAVRDPEFLRKLAIPGTTAPWREARAGGWGEAVGLGPLRVASSEPGRALTLVRADAGGGRARPDTVEVRFTSSTARVRSLLRGGVPDLVWPLPARLLDEAVPAGYSVAVRPAKPARRLVLVQRADLPPTTRLPARAALSHGLNRAELLRALRREGREVVEWVPGAGRYEYPSLDRSEIELWRERGRLGRSFHVRMAYDEQGPGGLVGRMMQGEWAANDVYVELEPLHGQRRYAEPLAGQSHLVLAEWRDLLDTPSGFLAPAIQPLRGPAVGAVRTGWRTREFDRWILPRERTEPFRPDLVLRRFEEERIVIPLADLPWVWIERSAGTPARFDPGRGPSCPFPAGEPASPR